MSEEREKHPGFPFTFVDAEEIDRLEEQFEDVEWTADFGPDIWMGDKHACVTVNYADRKVSAYSTAELTEPDVTCGFRMVPC